MTVYFGNVSVDKLEERCGWKFSEEDKKWLNDHRQTSANNIGKNEFHIFDLPFFIQVGEDISDELVEMLTKYNNEKGSEESLRIGVIG